MCPKNRGQYKSSQPFSGLVSIRGVFIGYTYVSVMCRLCIGYVSVTRRLRDGAYGQRRGGEGGGVAKGEGGSEEGEMAKGRGETVENTLLTYVSITKKVKILHISTKNTTFVAEKRESVYY